MAYTPKTWTCGETITDEGLNNIEEGIQEALDCCESELPAVTAADNGDVLTVVNGQWDKAAPGSGDAGYECTSTDTTLTEETITTTAGTQKALHYSTAITADPLIVTYDGTEYVCPRTESLGSVYYGDYQSTTTFPFGFLCWGSTTYIKTATGGSHTVKLASRTETVTTTECFSKAVKSVAGGLEHIFDGIADGSLRGNLTTAESASYSLGQGAVTLGTNTKATGQNALAEGANTQATAQYAHAEGTYSVASGSASHAEGNATASGSYSHAEGQVAKAIGSASHAEGYHAEAQAIHSHAEGNTSIASADGAHAEGYYTEASGNYSHSEGRSTTASGVNSHAEGASTKATSQNAHAEGQGTTASGNQSHAEGQQTKATAQASHAEGYQTEAAELGAHAEGEHAVASGRNSHAEGDTTTASGWAAHAEGQGTVASGQATHAGGNGTIAQSPWQTAIGMYNEAQGDPDVGGGPADYAFIIGNGTGDDARSNALAIKWDGTFVFANGTTITPAQFAALRALLP